MTNVQKLTITEAVIVDPLKLTELCIIKGEAGAEVLVGRTMEELAHGLAKVEDAYIAQNLNELAARAALLVPLAEEIGMTTFAQVTRDVMSCARAAQILPLSATLSRLMRIADKSLNAMWDMENMTL